MTTTSGWDGILQDGEEILWQGQPDSRVAFRDALTPGGLFGLFFAGFALFWMAASASMIAGQPGIGPFVVFPLFGLPFLLIGLYLAGGHIFFDAYKRSNTWYTLTDRTAFVATNRRGRRTLDSYPIRDMDFVRLVDGTPGSVVFAKPAPNGGKGRKGRNSVDLGAMSSGIGFHRIEDARHVYGRLRRLRAALDEARTDRPQGGGADR